ncbi:hypothetical protein [Hymenobacter sp. B1770]|uniref:hypothetical protein n=1 Tax=Hymenobacter sp. B1770 TaxID=1718788 RepID=UPI003CF234F6
MKKPNIIAGIAFGLGSTSQLVLGNYFAALATGLFAGGMILSDTFYRPPTARVAVVPLSTWRRFTCLLLLGASIALFGYDIGRALYQATQKLTANTPIK